MLNKLHTTHRRINRQPTYIPTPSVQILTTDVRESIALDTHIFIEKFVDANLNVNDCYKLINSFQRSKKLPACMILNDVILVDDLDKANGFNKYFCSVFKKDSLPFSDFSENTLNNVKFTIQDVDKALRQTKRGFSTDAINGDFILQTSNALGIHYHNLLKNLLNHSYWPNEWKQAIITPLHKSGNVESICNYRPISCLSKLSLVFERLLFNKLYDFFSPQLSGSQFGFMRRKFTVLQLIIFLQAIYNNVDKNTDCYALYLDFSKAFDSVSHATLLAKLRLFGIGGSLLSLLSSYLTNRVQRVKLNNITSASLPVTSGVPQGSILGPLLFLVFINDLPTQVSHSQILLYADDPKLIHNNLLQMQNDILALSQWSQLNKLSFNAKKTQLISFDYRSQNRITDIPVLILDDHEIFLQKSVVDLGLSFSSNLAWSKHISDRLKACYIRIISLRRRLPPHLHSQIKIKLYKTYILPKLLYGSQVWSPNQKDLSKLEQFQKNVSKWICKGATYKTRLMASGLLPINLLLKINDLLFLNRILNGMYDFDFHNFLSITYPCDSFYYNTRSTLKRVLKVKSTRTKHAGNHFFQRIVPLSN